jgi:hypothetical protein
MQISISNAIGGTKSSPPPGPPAFNTKSILLDGVDDFVSLNTQVSFAGEFTSSFWIKPDSFTNNTRAPIGSDSPTLFIQMPNAAYIRYSMGVGSAINFIDGSNPMVVQQWNHIMFCRNSSSVVTVYVNGAQFSTSQTVNGNFGLKNIGRWSTAAFPGAVDEVAYWNTDQSANVSAIYNGGLPASLAPYNPLGWWRFEGTGTTATDSGSGGNDGTLTNGAVRTTDVPT